MLLNIYHIRKCFQNNRIWFCYIHPNRTASSENKSFVTNRWFFLSIILYFKKCHNNSLKVCILMNIDNYVIIILFIHHYYLQINLFSRDFVKVSFYIKTYYGNRKLHSLTARMVTEFSKWTYLCNHQLHQKESNASTQNLLMTHLNQYDFLNYFTVY